jgi:hypothetical protein
MSQPSDDGSTAARQLSRKYLENFYRQFKGQFGHTPGEHRRRHPVDVTLKASLPVSRAAPNFTRSRDFNDGGNFR